MLRFSLGWAFTVTMAIAMLSISSTGAVGRGGRNSPTLRWRKGSRCRLENCVEAATDGTAVLLRNSTDPAGPVLSFSRSAWAGLLEGIRDGDFGR